MVSKEKFQALAQEGYNRIPLMREVLADFDTPLSTYCRLAREPQTYLFESVQGGEKWGRYSMIGLPCAKRIEVHEDEFTVVQDNEVIERRRSSNPLKEIREFHNRWKVPMLDGLPKFTGGLVGYFGYDTVRYIEPKLGACTKASEISVPDICLMSSEEVVVFDNFSGRLYLIVHADATHDDAWDKGQSRLEQLIAKLREPIQSRPALSLDTMSNNSEFTSSFGRAEFEKAVKKSREYILAGDIFQVVLSQRLSAGFTGDPLDLYRALRTVNPSPYMYYINMNSYHIVGSSPEILVRSEDGVVTVRPLAGTRPRGENEEQDKQLEEELLADEKERAEHVMLVDLGRNDVGRVSKLGTVKVTEVMKIERYSHVMHIVSNVVGEIRPDMDGIDALEAALPAGTVSGAPKVRAMEIIDELEPCKRGIYAGAIGYIGWHGNVDTAIAIRTAILEGNLVYVQAGAGLVADSVPSREWVETMDKAQALLRAVAMAETMQ